MVSSEVQRTLVKSPPELWTELSDPAALARHLGELGEIEITRTVPEKLIEWQAAGTSGKIAIKASGWGTKVTLSVEREAVVAESSGQTGDPDAGSLPGSDAEPGSDQGAAEIPEPEPGGEPAPVARAEAGDEAVAGVSPAAGDPPVPEIAQDVSSSEGSPVTSVPEDSPTAAADAPPTANEDTAEHSPTADTSPSADATNLQTERRAGPAPATAAARRAAGWPNDDNAAKSEVDPTPMPATEVAPEPRRGFLSRLFGGRRRKQATPPVEDATTPAPDSPESTAAEESLLPSDRPSGNQQPSDRHTVDMSSDDEPSGNQQPSDRHTVDMSSDDEPSGILDPANETHSPLHRGEQSASAEEPVPPSAGEQHSSEAAQEPEPAIVTGETDPIVSTEDSAPVADANEPEPTADPSLIIDAANETGPNASSETPVADATSGTGEDLAAELKAAEEIAAEEVTAILTGVLDRLGAAHHRPFSRS